MGTDAGGLVRITAPAAPPEEGHPDIHLARAVLQRDRKAAAELVEKFSGPVYAYVRSRLFPRTDLVDDLVQDVFLTVWEHLPGYRGTSPLRSWILGVARHKVEDHYRQRLRQYEQWDEAGPDPPDDGAPPVDEAIDRRRLSERTRRVLSQLPEHYAAILLWRYWERRASREIAEAAGRTEKAVERLLARAREDFRRRWQDA